MKVAEGLNGIAMGHERLMRCIFRSTPRWLSALIHYMLAPCLWEFEHDL